MDFSLLGFSVHGILQARKLEWVAIPSSMGSPQPRDQTCVAGGYGWATGEASVCSHIFVIKKSEILYFHHN